jgi:hypothetical protein
MLHADKGYDYAHGRRALRRHKIDPGTPGAASCAMMPSPGMVLGSLSASPALTCP